MQLENQRNVIKPRSKGTRQTVVTQGSRSLPVPNDGYARVVVSRVQPEIDGGRFPIKRVVGDAVVVEADIFADGPDAVACSLLYRHEADPSWTSAPMTPLVNDRWRGVFTVPKLGRYIWTVQAWVDRFETWRRWLARRMAANQDIAMELLTGASLVEAAAARASGPRALWLARQATAIRKDPAPEKRLRAALDETLRARMAFFPDTSTSAQYDKELVVVVEPLRARTGAWYEMFPRSSSPIPGRHGTFADCAERLPYVAEMGFDVLYLPPIHPIGHTHRKGKNNALQAGPEDPGSPWAIGSGEGGHKSVHPQLGSLEDFRSLLANARALGIEVALDLAFQCSPDHPYVSQHPEWFRHGPDGRILYAENPPKKYEDVYPFDFESDAWPALWEELQSIVLFWVRQGVRIFRVDNPHTKPFRFWEWLFTEVKRAHPETIFLAEAFTRPTVLHQLAKLGFSQSYTYFTWRNSKDELTSYFTELGQPDIRQYLRPNLWVNTPDILTEYLQFGGRAAFMTRLVLAATLGASYGVYGPPFELGEATPRDPGGEEYLDSEKYQIRHWNLDREDSLKDFIARVNRIRRENPVLRSDGSVAFHATDNDQIICYSRTSEDAAESILVIVNLDPHHTQSGWVDVIPSALGVEGDQVFQTHDLLGGARFLWKGHRNYVSLDPGVVPAHIFRVRRKVRHERDFDYYL